MSTPLLDAVTVEVWMPTPGAAFTLDVNRLSPYSPTQPGLGAPADEGAWTPLLGDATNVQIRRGGPRTSYTSQAQVGTLHLTVRNRADIVLNPALRPGLPIRVSLADGTTRIFTGKILDLDTSVALEPLTGKQVLVTTFSAVDAVQQLVNTTRYGALVTGRPEDQPYVAESWVERIHRLMKSADGLPYAIDAAGHPGGAMASTDLETSLAAYLDMTVNSYAALWCVNADGTVQFRYLPKGASSSAVRFTDGTTSGSSPLYPYTDIKYDFGTKDLITTLTLTNREFLSAGYSPTEGTTYQFTTRELVYSDETLIATYARRSANIDINRLAGSVVAPDLAKRFLSASRAGRANVRSIKVNARTNPAQVAAVELCTRIHVRVPAPISQWETPVVTGIDHDITPGRWITTFHLMRSHS